MEEYSAGATSDTPRLGAGSSAWRTTPTSAACHAGADRSLLPFKAEGGKLFFHSRPRAVRAFYDSIAAQDEFFKHLAAV